VTDSPAPPAPPTRGRRSLVPRWRRPGPDLLLGGALFILALALRVWGVTWSLPYVGHVDEPKIVDSAVRIVKTGDFNPHLFIWPSLVIYAQALIYKVNLIWGMARGYYAGPESLPDSNHIFALAPQLYLWGRDFSALIGAAAVAGTYGLGRAMFGRAAGLAGALLLLTSPLHVEYSHYLVTDVTMGACGLLALIGAWRLMERPGAGRALLAGGAVGLAAAAKYNGLYIALPVALAWLLGGRRARTQDPARFSWPRWLVVAAGMALAGAGVFLCANPYVLLDWPDWSRGFVFQVNAYLPATTLQQAGAAYTKQLDQLWRTDAALLAAGVAGGLWLLVDAVRGRRSDPARARAAWLLLLFPPVYAGLMARFTEVFERNLIVALPCLCLAAGYAVQRIGALLAARRPVRLLGALPAAGVISALIALALAAEPARRTVNFDSYMALTESRNAAFAWLEGELAAGARAAVELHPLQVCAPPPYACPAPDALAPNIQLTDRPPDWYAARGYDYALLVGDSVAIIGDPTQSGRRPPDKLAAYQALPLVRLFPGDAEGAKGPTVRVYRVGGGPAAMQGLRRSGARFGDLAELWGYALAALPTAGAPYDPAAPPPAMPYRPGAAIGIRLAWRGLPGAAALPGNWTVALHLLDAAGATVAQVDTTPISSGRLRPTRAWYDNEFLDGAYNMPLPPTLPAGAYRLTIAFYDAPRGPGLPVTGPEGAGPSLDLGAISVTR
jgi:hypothetical protein